MMNNIYAQQLTQSGYLQVSVFAVDVGKPVSNARIRISLKGDNGNVIIDELITDELGQTLAIGLDAPPIEFSLDVNINQKPYSEYDIAVDADGYESVIIAGIQILSNTIAVQEVFLKPRVVMTQQVAMISIDEHTLWGIFPPKIPESPVKELPPSKGFVVLPDPVIPEFVVVHAGAPSDSSAPNYWVPFKSYISNVASCEIYPTWPEETIQANVLAILSFTLNRIYTEWYRGKGYNFTITNSTAYDHAFSHGRNIFRQISRVVDELFTSFITKPGIRQPLFTQYCDGKRTQCPNWMTQWGSKDLGDQGYVAVDILKSFYGYDIFLMQAQSVEGVPSSFPGRNLQAGSSGPEVRTIQEQLNAISDNFPAIRKVRVNGVFDDATREAVSTFQRIFGMPDSGIVDFPTWYRISDIYVAVERLAELK